MRLFLFTLLIINSPLVSILSPDAPLHMFFDSSVDDPSVNADKLLEEMAAWWSLSLHDDPWQTFDKDLPFGFRVTCGRQEPNGEIVIFKTLFLSNSIKRYLTYYIAILETPLLFFPGCPFAGLQCPYLEHLFPSIQSWSIERFSSTALLFLYCSIAWRSNSCNIV